MRLCLCREGMVEHSQGCGVVDGEVAEMFVEHGHGTLEFIGRPQVFELMNRLF